MVEEAELSIREQIYLVGAVAEGAYTSLLIFLLAHYRQLYRSRLGLVDQAVQAQMLTGTMAVQGDKVETQHSETISLRMVEAVGQVDRLTVTLQAVDQLDSSAPAELLLQEPRQQLA